MKFDVLYVDNPWSFDMKTTGGNFKSGAVQKYPTMPVADICNLPVTAIASPSCALFLWVPTALKFSHAGPVAHAWGFDYITTVYWDKQRLGMGAWFRNVIEELLVFQRRGGSLAPFGCQLPNKIACPPGEHSTKPEAFRQLIEKATGKISRRDCVELFARRVVPGWTAAGNMVTGRDIREDLKLLAAAEGVTSWPRVLAPEGMV